MPILRAVVAAAAALGLLLAVVVHPASVPDRDGAKPLLRKARRPFAFITRTGGDAGYQGPKRATARCGSGTSTAE